MNYADYQKTVTAKINVKAVAVDLGKGCVEPSQDHLIDGTYPFTQNLYVVLNAASFVRPEIRAFVWYLLSDDALTTIDKQGYVGTDKAGFVTTRDAALEKFTQAAAPPTPQPTPTAGTPSANPTAQPTGQATAALSPAQTIVPTTASTVVPTAVPTTVQGAPPPPTVASGQ